MITNEKDALRVLINKGRSAHIPKGVLRFYFRWFDELYGNDYPKGNRKELALQHIWSIKTRHNLWPNN